MARADNDYGFTAIRVEGGLLPPEYLQTINALQATHQASTDYGLTRSLNIKDEIGRYWRMATDLWADYQVRRQRTDLDPVRVAVDEWLLPLFEHILGYHDITPCMPVIIGERHFPVGHKACSKTVPLLLTGHMYDLDKAELRFGDVGRRRPPYGLLQEYLNADDACLWGMVSNGNLVRLARDNPSLTRPAFIEADLERMFEEQLFADFAAFWLLLHVSRVAPHDGSPAKCLLEAWRTESLETGERARAKLRLGVTAALRQFGNGFLEHRANDNLRQALNTGEITETGYYQELLRLVYRLLFLFTVEDRNLLFHPEASGETQRLYTEGYALVRLRDRALKRRHYDQYGDLWDGLLVVFRGLAKGAEPLGLPALWGLFADDQCPHLDTCTITNDRLLQAVRALTFFDSGKALARVNYRDMGTEELGSVYESLLELHPSIAVAPWSFGFVGDSQEETIRGSARKTTGSYYTPPVLVNELIKSALVPVIEQTLRDHQDRPREALLGLKIVDPTCGSGHFLLAAARRVATEIARLDAGPDTPGEALRQHALRDVVRHCIYGVDNNPLAVELCKAALWIETVEPGKPLSFLDHHIRVGNSLLGATPALIAGGLPDKALTAIEGDDKKACAVLKKRNKAERKGLGPLFVAQDAETQARLQQSAAALEALPDDRPEDIRAKELAFRHHEQTEDYRHKKQLADAWCAAFVIRKYFREPGRAASASGLTQAHLNDLVGGRALPDELCAATERVSRQYRFFHWHLAFPEVFAEGGFDVVLGNPPWERIKIQEKEWFAGKRDDISEARNSAERKTLIESLKTDDQTLYAAYAEDQRKAEGDSHFVRNSGRFPLCGRGDVNTYSIFTETNRLIIGPTGRVGCVIPSGIATDDTTKFFFQDLVTSHSLVSLYDFENVKNIFPGVGHGRFKFCLLTFSGAKSPVAASDFVFFAHSVEDIGEVGRHFTLTARDIALINPNTFTCAMFGSTQDAAIGKHIYRRVSVLIREGPPEENPWGITFMRMLDMANDSALFRREALPGHVPLYEAKMVQHFDHRYGDYADYPEGALTTILPTVPKERLEDPTYTITPRYWVEKGEALERLHGRWEHEWLLGWRDVTHATNDRTLIASVIPWAATNNKFLLMFPSQPPTRVAGLLANLNSFILDYNARQKVGGLSLNYFIIKQFPVLRPEIYEQPCDWAVERNARAGSLNSIRLPGRIETEQQALPPGDEAPASLAEWLVPRVLELVYTTWDLEPFAQDCGWSGPPFHWDEERRFLLRCELDAAFFHLYLPAEKNGDWRPADGETAADLARLKASFPTPRDAVAYIMDTFPIVRRRDEAKFGEYRTKRVILDIYDAMQQAITTGEPYHTRLDPLPADPRVAHEAQVLST